MYYLFLFLLLFFIEEPDATISFNKKDAVVWHPVQIISGEINGFTSDKIKVHINDSSFVVNVDKTGRFDFQALIKWGKNIIWAESQDKKVISDTLHYTLGYNPVPIVKPFATIQNNDILLSAKVLENPYDFNLNYYWTNGSKNPSRLNISNRTNKNAFVKIPKKNGIYYFNLWVKAGSDSVNYQTMIIKEEGKVKAFDIEKDNPTWMDEAIIYEITPYSFVKDGKFKDITKKLPELKELGINTIWLQPVYKSSYKGQGYDIVNYFEINPDLGTKAELKELIKKAKDLGLKVLFDMVINHTSIKHPYAEERLKLGSKSHYYDYYQTKDDGKPYSTHYNIDQNNFVTYFWRDLVNLNYENEEVQRWMLEVCKYWVREYDIDGYRFDAIWGINARKPSFSKRLREELKSINPDLIMIAEDKGADPKVYEHGYDAAYDWTMDTVWVSQWSWQYDYDDNENLTIFNYSESDERDDLLEEILSSNKDILYRQMHFLENNDHHRFIADHDLKQTKMAAGLMFALPGIPMIYNGQENGVSGHPYATEAIFHSDSTIQSTDKKKIFDYYQRLISLRKEHESLTDTTFQIIKTDPDGALAAFHRWKGDEHMLILINMDSTIATTSIDIKEFLPKANHKKSYSFKDLLSDSTFKTKRSSTLNIPMDGFRMRWLLLEDQN